MDILELTLGMHREVSDRVARHVRSCESCHARVENIRHLLGDVAAYGQETADESEAHLDESALAEIAEGNGNAELAQARLDHLAACATCRRGLASLLDLLTDEHVSREMRRLHAPEGHARASRRRFAVAGGVLASGFAAAAALLIIGRGRHDQLAQNRSAHRAASAVSADAPALASPVGDVEAAKLFLWSRVRDVNAYRLTLFDAGGRVVYERELSDTTLALPDSVAVTPRASYLWKVEARNRQGRWATSPLVEFRIQNVRAP